MPTAPPESPAHRQVLNGRLWELVTRVAAVAVIGLFGWVVTIEGRVSSTAANRWTIFNEQARQQWESTNFIDRNDLGALRGEIEKLSTLVSQSIDAIQKHSDSTNHRNRGDRS